MDQRRRGRGGRQPAYANPAVGLVRPRIIRQAIRRGTFTSVKDLFIDGWNDRCEPFVWTKTADEILAEAQPRKKTSNTRH